MIDKPVEGWTGPTGYINKDLIQKYVASKDLGAKVKVFVCGKPIIRSAWVADTLLMAISGPPGQVASISGQKAGMKQGDLGGILKELGYTQDQVIGIIFNFMSLEH